MALFFNFDLMTLGVNTIPLAEKLRIQEEHILELLRTNSVTRVFYPSLTFPFTVFCHLGIIFLSVMLVNYFQIFFGYQR